ncbi:MAG: hypothetical protein ACRYG4_09225 [Janthinobacterium lividum]
MTTFDLDLDPVVVALALRDAQRAVVVATSFAEVDLPGTMMDVLSAELAVQLLAMTPRLLDADDPGRGLIYKPTPPPDLAEVL